MFQNSNRPPSKTKPTRSIDLPKYPLPTDTFAKTKKDSKPLVFTEQTHNRLNDLYRKYIQERQQQQFSPERSQRLISNDNQDSVNHSSEQHIQTQNSIEGKKEYNYIEPRDQMRSEKQAKPSKTIEPFREQKSTVVRAQKPEPNISIEGGSTLQRVKTRFQRIVFEEVEVTENKMLKNLSTINEKTVKLEFRFSRLITSFVAMSNALEQLKFRAGENTVLRELNKQLERKIKSLELERKALKEEKELETMKQTVNKMKQTNVVKQERGATPGKDRSTDTERKILIKENLDLKKAKQVAQKKLEQVLMDYQRLRQSFQELNNYCKDIQTGRQLNEQKQQLYRKMAEHAEEVQKKYDALQFECDRRQTKIDQLTAALQSTKSKINKKEQQINALKLASKQQMNAQSRINEMTVQLQEANNALVNAQKQLQTNKRIMQRRQSQDKLKTKEIEQLKTQNDKLRQDLSESIKARQLEQVNQTAKMAVQQPNKQQQRKLRKQLEQLVGKLQLNKQEIGKLSSSQSSLKLKVERMEFQNREISQQLERVKSELIEKQKQIAVQNEKSNAPQSYEAVTKALRYLLQMEAPNIRVLPSQVNQLLMQVHSLLKTTTQKMQNAELQLKKLSIHKNKLDHILHQEQEQRVEYNEFETTQADAYFFRQKPKTDANLSSELKKVAKKLDVQLEQNLKNRGELHRQKKVIEELRMNSKLARDSLLSIVSDIDTSQKEQQLSVLVNALDISQEKGRLRKKLIQQ